jgi:glycosyltransferase involved in cell wall biosynthesis
MDERMMVFIPAYNCARQISRVLAQFTPDIQRRFKEIVVIDNCSSDGTRETALSAFEKIEGCKTTLLQNHQNYGLGGSHKVAFHYALANSYDYCLVLHGDDQGDIKDILPELDRGMHRHYDCLLSARFMPGSRLKGYSRFRTFGNWGFNILATLVSFRLQWDMGSGLCCFSRSFLERHIYMKSSDDLTFNYTLQLYCASHNVTQRFFPVSWREDDQISNARLFQLTFKMLKILAFYTFCRRQFLKASMGSPTFDYAASVIEIPSKGRS